MLTRIRSGLSYANVMATAAVVVALGGGALAATGLVGSDGKIRGCVGMQGKLTVLKPPKKKCPSGQTAVTWNRAGRVGQPGAPGPKGDQGDRGLQGEMGVQGLTGLTGDTGAQGPGTMTINQQVARDGNSHTITTINGLTISVLCAPAGPNDHITVDVAAPDSDHFYHAWGTQTTFSVVPASTLIQGSNGQPFGIGGIGDSQSILQLDVVAAARPASPPVRFTHFLLDVLSANACNFHGLVIPPS